MKYSTLRTLTRAKYKVIGNFNLMMVRVGIKKLIVDADKDESCTLRMDGWVVIKDNIGGGIDMIPVTMVSRELQEAFGKEINKLKIKYA